MIQSSARQERFLTVQDFAIFSVFSRFFFLSCFLAIFSLSALSLFCNCSLFAFRSFLASGSFLLPFEDHQFGVFKQKLKRMPLLLFLCTNNSNSDECAKRRAVVYHRRIFARSCSLRACVCERESKRERACNTTFLKWKKMYGKERASNQKTEKIRLLFSLAERGREGR